MERQSDGVRKGPWTAEEDEVLISHVKKHGPRDWSSIRSKGLLPRNGKSCRLRWVNKLRPNLKTGCKFTAEEERMVIQLQGQFGNKWAKIATFLPGRTDNDVKNFWSTRRKRFERIMQKSASFKSQKNKGKSPLVHHELPEVACNPSNSGTSCCNNYEFNCLSNSQEFRMVALPDLVRANALLDVEAGQRLLETIPTMPCDDLSQLPFLSDCKELDENPSKVDVFGQEIPECQSGQKLFKEENDASSKLEELKDLSTPNILFDDFPPEMFDYLETLSSSPEL